MAPTKITYSDNNAVPPVYVAGSFTNWQAIELHAAQSEEGHVFEKTFDLAPGTYQYKFRLGSGDWWVCDAQAPHSRDDAGNENNEIVVASEPEAPVPAATAIAPVNGIHEQVTSIPQKEVKASAVPPVEPATVQPTPKTNGVAKAPEPSQPVVPAKEEVVVPVTKPKEAEVQKPQVEAVNGSASPKPAKEAVSKGSTDSSVLPKVSEKDQSEPKKIGCFSRFFLCGSSRQ